ncbi:uncharacterized protein LOC108676862 [Hyalella azteca]|uniref:Uncharacterized protein LOC108676862 n=1 Tax=Hyalella azteca TaxID=294128 RepID=A0A8B7P311_HYAAZ|nr:uncharacterized protein LOC108676862 [Hyalella azteca]
MLEELASAQQQIKDNDTLFQKVVSNHQKVKEQLPAIESQYEVLKQQFRALDKLSKLVEKVSADVTKLESAMAAAELQLLGEQPSLAHRLLQPVLKRFDVEAGNENTGQTGNYAFQIFNPADYLTSDSISTTPTKRIPSPDNNVVEPGIDACFLDDVSNMRLSNYHESNDAGFGPSSSTNNNNLAQSTSEQLLLDDEELCST